MNNKTLVTAIKNAVKSSFKVDVIPKITYPDHVFGDFTTNVAFQLKGKVDLSPLKIAEKLADSISHPSIKKISIDGSGFLNFTMKDSYWASSINKINDNFVKSSFGRNKEVQVEFISANPTGPLTLANMRGGYAGDVISNVLEASGFKVSREYYVNDFGGQVQALYNSVSLGVYEKIPIKEPKSFDKIYKGTYIDDIATEVAGAIKEKYGDEAYSLSSSDVDELVAKYGVVDKILKQIKTSVSKMGIKFDKWFSEKVELHEKGKIEDVIHRLESTDLVEFREGARWLKSRKNNDKERVLVKSDGSPTYLLADIAYHWSKLAERKFDKAVNLWGADHAAQVSSLKSVLKLLQLGDKVDIIIFQIVRLIKNKQELKISKRSGTYITVDDLLNEIPSDVARFFFLMRSFDTHMDFDLDLAREQSKKNPYYYVMYAYVRCHSIMSEAKRVQLEPAHEVTEIMDSEIKLIKEINKLPDLLSQIAKTYEVHKLTFWGMEAAKAFHDFYEKERVITNNLDESKEKLFLIKQFMTVMEQYFKLMGITPKSKM